jgi:hypothetical protein
VRESQKVIPRPFADYFVVLQKANMVRRDRKLKKHVDNENLLETAPGMNRD